MTRGRKPDPNPKTVCDCGKPSYIKRTGLCRSCHERAYRQRRKAEGRPIQRTESYKDCEVCGVKKVWCRGMCVPCYFRDYRLDKPSRTGQDWRRYHDPHRRRKAKESEGPKPKPRTHGEGRRKTNNDLFEGKDPR